MVYAEDLPKRGYQQEVEPLEQTDPGLAELFNQVSNKTHPIIGAINVGLEKVTLYKRNGGVRVLVVRLPNDPCYCGSDKKYKKCCK